MPERSERVLNTMWSAVELRDIRVFLTLAEELHFGRTAERLQLTPSRVSQVIRDLELKVGGRLVERTSRRVALTPLGARFREKVIGPYDQLSAVLARMDVFGDGRQAPLRLHLLSDPGVSQMPASPRAPIFPSSSSPAPGRASRSRWPTATPSAWPSADWWRCHSTSPGFGLSGGEPREVESPDLKARDIESAVSLLRQHRAIDAERVGALAICASAGSAANASIHDVHLRALALIAPWLHDPRAAMRRSPTERAASTRG